MTTTTPEPPSNAQRQQKQNDTVNNAQQWIDIALETRLKTTEQTRQNLTGSGHTPLTMFGLDVTVKIDLLTSSSPSS